ncbi:hypothetical protein GSI_15060 [Ganoderma sinense ZZ0214-1]|uniref:Uncharacterized protein n=1 Tax=Ganoderma sinense ZZ0214-1 TaxID=1077348 RepID=A0A2G8RLI2_9APHY|nr:hypothetical protein GSI_15060 [Ganoderma sinense ZZ0214-1]
MAAQGELCRSPNGDISTNAHPGRVHHPLPFLLTAPAVPDPSAAAPPPGLALSSSPALPLPPPSSVQQWPASMHRAQRPTCAFRAQPRLPAQSGDSSGNSSISASAPVAPVAFFRLPSKG